MARERPLVIIVRTHARFDRLALHAAHQQAQYRWWNPTLEPSLDAVRPNGCSDAAPHRDRPSLNETTVSIANESNEHDEHLSDPEQRYHRSTKDRRYEASDATFSASAAAPPVPPASSPPEISASLEISPSTEHETIHVELESPDEIAPQPVDVPVDFPVQDSIPPNGLDEEVHPPTLARSSHPADTQPT